ncbi:MAG TPA: hypothetical protein VF680_08525 [Allosphingosinicella sp.]
MFELAIAVTAALAFPIVAVVVHRSRASNRDRRLARRRNDRIKL